LSERYTECIEGDHAIEIDSLGDFVVEGFFDEFLIASEYFDIDHILGGYYVYICVSIAEVHSFAKKYFIWYARSMSSLQTLNISTIALILSALLVYGSMFRYIYSIIYGSTRPNVVGWLLYEIATLCILISSYELGSIPTIMLSLAFAITQLIVIVLAFRYGFARMDRVEGAYFGISMLSLMFWVIARHSPELALSIGMTDRGLAIFLLTTNTLIDAMGAIAIFTKLYKHPGTEDRLAWLLGGLSGFFAIIAV
jgi:hypothetical protein